jgi:hypothetical protein
MEWQFSEANDPVNQPHPTARLIYGVPETDNVQVSGICDGGAGSAAKSSSVTFGADIGDLQNGKDTELRVSGGGFDHALKGQIFRATGEEGLSGVRVDVENDNPLWQAFAEKDSVDYLVPGYKASSLDLTKGRDKIQQFVKACAAYAAAGAPAESAGGGGDAEKDAFESAKELGTVEAWQAFITVRLSCRSRQGLYSRSLDRASRPTCLRHPMSARRSSCRTRRAGTAETSARKSPPRRPNSPSSTDPARRATSCGSISTRRRRATVT